MQPDVVSNALTVKINSRIFIDGNIPHIEGGCHGVFTPAKIF